MSQTISNDIDTATPITPVTDVSLAVGLTRAEVDTQIATAHQFPRSIKRAMTNIASMATLDEDTAEECMYSIPRDGKVIEGPSARFAELVAQSWGNCRVAARVVREEKDYIVAQAVYHDLETNTAMSTEVQRRIVGRGGRRYSPDMIVTTGNAACSIARRNIILAGVPRAAYRKAYEAARQVVMGDAETLANRRSNALKAFMRYGVTADQIFAALKLEGEAEITLGHLVTLRSMLATLKNGEATAEEMFAQTGRTAKATDPSYNPLVDKETVNTDTGEITNQKPAASSAQVNTGDASQENDKPQPENSTETASGLSSGQGTEEAAPTKSDIAADPSVPTSLVSNDASSGNSAADQSGGVIPHDATATSYAFGDYARALARASQEKSLSSFDQQFRNKFAWTTNDDALPRLREIFALHRKKLRGEVKPDAFMAELTKLGAAA